MSTPVTFTDSDRLILEAARGLLGSNSTTEYQKGIWEMFESWIGSDLTDGLNGRDRATVWFACRDLHEFLDKVKDVPPSGLAFQVGV